MAGLTTHRVGFADAPKLPDNGRCDLSGIDQDCPPIHTNAFLIFRNILEQDDSPQAIVDAHVIGLQKTLEYLPILAGVATYTPSGTLYYHVTPESTIQFTTQDLRKDPYTPDLEDLAREGYPENRFDLFKLESYRSTDWADLTTLRHKPGAPAAFARLSFVKGGALLSLGISHKVGDNGSTDLWAKTWAACSQRALGHALTRVPPLRVDPFWYLPRLLPDVEFEAVQKRVKAFKVIQPDAVRNMWMVGKDPEGHLLRFSPEAITKLKLQCRPDDDDFFVSTYDCVTAVLTQAMTRCRITDPGFNETKEVCVMYPNNLRRKEPRVGPGYFGNSFALGTVGPMQARDVLAPTGLKMTANLSRQAIVHDGLSYYMNVYDMKKTAESKGLVVDPTMRINTALDCCITSWSLMDLDAYDFGFGPCDAVRTGPTVSTGVAYVWPTTEAKKETDGVFATLVMESAHWMLLRKDEEFLRWVSIVN